MKTIFAFLAAFLILAVPASAATTMDMTYNQDKGNGQIQTSIKDNGIKFNQEVSIYGNTQLMHSVETDSSFTVTDSWKGNGGFVGMHSKFKSPDVKVNDKFGSGAYGKFSGGQMATNVPVQWEYNENALSLERGATWKNGGVALGKTVYEDEASWWDAKYSQGFIVASNQGDFMQDQLFTYHKAGTWEYDQWKIQRDMGAEVKGPYVMGTKITDLRGDESGSKDYEFKFVAYNQNPSRATMIFDKSYVNAEHGSGQWHNEDGFHTGFYYEGNNYPTVNTHTYGYTNLDSSVYSEMNSNGKFTMTGTVEGN